MLQQKQYENILKHKDNINKNVGVKTGSLTSHRLKPYGFYAPLYKMNKEAQILKEDGIEYVYQPIHFKPEITNHYFAGDAFVGMNQKEELQGGKLPERIAEGGRDGFVPELIKELTEVIGEENQKYDGYEFGEDETNLYFLIKKEYYHLIMPALNGWKLSKGFKELMWFDIKDVD